MAADGTLLQGEVIEDPQAETKDVERLLQGFLRALLSEQSEGNHSERRNDLQEGEGK